MKTSKRRKNVDNTAIVTPTRIVAASQCVWSKENDAILVFFFTIFYDLILA